MSRRCPRRSVTPARLRPQRPFRQRRPRRSPPTGPTLPGDPYPKRRGRRTPRRDVPHRRAVRGGILPTGQGIGEQPDRAAVTPANLLETPVAVLRTPGCSLRPPPGIHPVPRPRGSQGPAYRMVWDGETHRGPDSRPEPPHHRPEPSRESRGHGPGSRRERRDHRPEPSRDLRALGSVPRPGRRIPPARRHAGAIGVAPNRRRSPIP